MSRPAPPRIARILCPVDNSAGSRRAIAHALSLACLHGARVTALRVSEAAGDAGSLLRARRAGTPAAGDVAQLVEEWDLAGASLDVVTAAGPVADGIVRQASALDSDLIVMGMRGRMNLSYVTLGALGSVTLEVVREAPCPVMVVPPGMRAESDGRYRQIVCPVDFGAASLLAVEYALSLAQAAGATLVLLHVLDPAAPRAREGYDTRPRPLDEAAARQALSALVPADARDYCRPIELVITGTPQDEILRTAGALQADVIVMGLGPRSAAERLLLGSTADPVLRKASCPVLTVHTPARQARG